MKSRKSLKKRAGRPARPGRLRTKREIARAIAVLLMFKGGYNG
jgi:hypothetical protein